MRFKSYIPALYVLTTQLDSLSKPSRPHKIMNIFFVIWALPLRFRFVAGLFATSFRSSPHKKLSAAIPNACSTFIKIPSS